MKAHIDIHWVSDDTIRIDVQDDASDIMFLTVTMSKLNFVDALFSKGYNDCDVELRGMERVGLKHEFKTEFIVVPLMTLMSDDSVRVAAAKAFEVDGWIARMDDLNNDHNRFNSDPNKVKMPAGHIRWRVTYDRWV